MTIPQSSSLPRFTYFFKSSLVFVLLICSRSEAGYLDVTSPLNDEWNEAQFALESAESIATSFPEDTSHLYVMESLLTSSNSDHDIARLTTTLRTVAASTAHKACSGQPMAAELPLEVWLSFTREVHSCDPMLTRVFRPPRCIKNWPLDSASHPIIAAR